MNTLLPVAMIAAILDGNYCPNFNPDTRLESNAIGFDKPYIIDSNRLLPALAEKQYVRTRVVPAIEMSHNSVHYLRRLLIVLPVNDSNTGTQIFS